MIEKYIVMRKIYESDRWYKWQSGDNCRWQLGHSFMAKESVCSLCLLKQIWLSSELKKKKNIKIIGFLYKF